MAPIRPAIDLIRQLWYSLDTASALRHGAPISERARQYTMAAPTPGTQILA